MLLSRVSPKKKITIKENELLLWLLICFSWNLEGNRRFRIFKYGARLPFRSWIQRNP